MLRCPTYKVRRSGLIAITDGPPAAGTSACRVKLAAVGIHGEGDDLVLVLQTNVERVWHLFLP